MKSNTMSSQTVATTDLAVGHEVQRVGIAVGEFDVGLELLEVGDDRVHAGAVRPRSRFFRRQRVVVEPLLAVRRGHGEDRRSRGTRCPSRPWSGW